MGSHEIIDRMNYDALGLADIHEYPSFFKPAGCKGEFPLSRVNKGGFISTPVV